MRRYIIAVAANFEFAYLNALRRPLIIRYYYTSHGVGKAARIYVCRNDFTLPYLDFLVQIARKIKARN